MADQSPSVSSDILSTLHPAWAVGCAGGASLECDRSLLRNLNRDVSDIKSSLQNLSRFEQDLSRHVELMQARVTEGNITPDEVRALLAGPSFVELISAVKQFKLQLPFTSYFEFSETHDDNSNSTNCDKDCNSDSEALKPSIDQLETKYEDLAPEQKECLCYCSAFDAEIKKRELINWWIGEDLLQDSLADSCGRVKKLEQVGEELLQQLGQQQFIRRIHKKKRASDAWLMEASVRTLIRSKAKEKGLFNSDEKILSQKAMLLRSDNRIDPLLDSITAGQVKTVFNVDRLRIGESEAKALALMENLAVLHLGRSKPKQHIHVKNHKLILERLKKMKQLRLLSLQGISSITKLSNSVSRLTSLLVLDLRACQALESLPSSIGKLQNLTRLDMSGCYILQPLPKEVSLLSNLEVLKGFVIGNNVSTKESKICTLPDLRLLKKLYKLSIFVLRKNFPQSQDLKDFANIEGLVKLKIQWIPASEQDRETVRSDRNEQGQETGDSSQHEQGQQNADQAVNLPAESSRNRIRTMSKCCFSNPVEDETEVQEKLEKLDLWYAPEDAGLMLLAPKNFIALKTLYIRWAKFQHLNCNRDANEEDKWKVETLRLLNLPNLEVRWEDLNNLFPEMSYLEVQDCPKHQFSKYLDEEGVRIWNDESS